jgi:2-polyprenyl-3-methyl-5-hydroxy-6-metoxy-1,4-benzoquinol methylase
LSIAPYLIIVLGVAQAIISIFLKDTHHHENVTNEKETVKNEVKQDLQIHQDKINQLQQLKQLLDDGILTQQEFDNQKSKILKK